MKREIVITADGSTTIHLPEWNEHYHSKHGAIQEAYHVFIKHGLHYYLQQHIAQKHAPISILEIGFGTGLNAYITLLEAEKHRQPIAYYGVEAYPISTAEVAQLNFATQLRSYNAITLFQTMHQVSWQQQHQLSTYFSLEKKCQFFSEISEHEMFHIIYFDAFGARVQPELWTTEIFEIMYRALKPQGILSTYAAKGSVRRAMLEVGFNVEKLPGPPGKREMLRATKP